MLHCIKRRLLTVVVSRAPAPVYTAYPQTAPTYAQTPPIVAASANGAAYTYPAAQYPAASPAPLAASTPSVPYYPQPTIAGGSAVTYSAAEGTYQVSLLHYHWSRASECYLRQQFYAIKNHLGQIPPMSY